MKKLLSIAVCASAVAAFAETTPVEVTLGEVGVTAITSGLTNTIVAVSYKELGDGDGNITISNIVKTANLTAGDLLHVFKDATTYETYTLTSGTGGLYWEKTQNYVVNEFGDLVVTNSTDASIATLGPGTAFWLVRKGWDGTGSFTFYIYGKPVTAAISRTLTSGEAALIGNPTQTAQVPTITTPTVGDVIQIPDASNVAIRMTKYRYTSNGWKTKKGGVTTYVLPNIQPGTGFWYVATEGSAPTISWSNL